jgi:hypothetical protein
MSVPQLSTLSLEVTHREERGTLEALIARLMAGWDLRR